MMEGAA